MKSWPALLPLALCACATVPVTGTFRHADFTGEKAPGPALALEVTACHTAGVPARTPPDPALTEPLYRRLSTARAPVDEPSRVRLCADFATERALFSDLTGGPDWSAGKPPVRVLAGVEANGAAAVLVPVLRLHGGCARQDAFFREGAPAVPGRLGGVPACGDDPRVDVGLFLFARDGKPLWRASATAGGPEPGSLQPVLEGLAAQVPADFIGPERLRSNQD